MLLSRFVLSYRSVRPNEHVLYDVVTDRYLGVDDVVLEALERRGEAGPALDREVEEILREQGFLVRDRAEDDARLRHFLETAAEGVPGKMFVTVMPTLVCNLACTYCFQKEHPAFTRMQTPTEEATLEWILRKVDAAASRVLHVHYFGGEPLTRKDYLLHSAEILSASMQARGARFEWAITTNGVDLDVPFVDQMLRFGEGTIKVTLDGDKETHDTQRVFRGGQGSFDRIFSRLKAVALGCPKVKLRIGGNFSPEHYDSYERLLERIEAEGLAGRIHQIRFKPVVDSARKEGTTCGGCAGSQDEVQMQLSLKKKVEARGLAVARSEGATPVSPCELHWKNSYVIDPEGRVYKCPAVAGRPEMAVSSVRDTRPFERKAPLVELRPWEQCGDCPYLPVCVGGCLGAKYLQTGRKDQVFCRKDQFDTAFEAEVLERYLSEFPEVDPDEAWGPSTHQAGAQP